MKITALVENTSKSSLKAKHGLSLYIKTNNHQILFDLGPDDTLFRNAKKSGIDLTNIDIVIISHGHMDHGGALSKFLQINSKAKIYVQEKAFDAHYSKTLFYKVPVGIDDKLKNNHQIVLLDGDYNIDDELILFTVNDTDKCYSPVNDVLYSKEGKDDFSHEQNLIILENQVTLVMGCGHCGIVNILDRAKQYHPHFCIGGFHLYNPITRKSVATSLLDKIVDELLLYNQIEFYTCHCTGLKAYHYLQKHLNNLSYLSCGDSITI